MKTLLLLTLLMSCQKETPKEKQYCAYCQYNTQRDTFCGSYDQVNDSFYKYAERRELEGEKWECFWIR